MDTNTIKKMIFDKLRDTTYYGSYRETVIVDTNGKPARKTLRCALPPTSLQSDHCEELASVLEEVLEILEDTISLRAEFEEDTVGEDVDW